MCQRTFFHIKKNVVVNFCRINLAKIYHTPMFLVSATHKLGVPIEQLTIEKAKVKVEFSLKKV